jgi:hypothetical protein
MITNEHFFTRIRCAAFFSACVPVHCSPPPYSSVLILVLLLTLTLPPAAASPPAPALSLALFPAVSLACCVIHAPIVCISSSRARTTDAGSPGAGARRSRWCAPSAIRMAVSPGLLGAVWGRGRWQCIVVCTVTARWQCLCLYGDSV